MLGFTTFEYSEKDETKLITYWEGKVAFADRNGPQPQTPLEVWTVVKVTPNPKGNVFFLLLGEKREDLIRVIHMSFEHGDTRQTYVDGVLVEGTFPSAYNGYNVPAWVARQLRKTMGSWSKAFHQDFVTEEAPVLKVIRAAEKLLVADNKHDKPAVESAVTVMVEQGALTFSEGLAVVRSMTAAWPGGKTEQWHKTIAYVNEHFLPMVVEALEKDNTVEWASVGNTGGLTIFPSDEAKDSFTSWRVEFGILNFIPNSLAAPRFDYRFGVETVARKILEACFKAAEE